jgi:hypothetical protein
MPVYLPPITRRRFLAGSFAAAAAVALGQGCASRGEENEESVALLSDIHIAADPKRIERQVNMTDNLKAVTKEVLAWPQRGGTVFINGDLAFDVGSNADYAAVLDLLRPLREEGCRFTWGWEIMTIGKTSGVFCGLRRQFRRACRADRRRLCAGRRRIGLCSIH